MPRALHDDAVVRVTSDVYAVTGSNTNWVIVKDGDSGTLIDTGYPGDQEAVLASLEKVGLHPRDVSAVLVTHAHNDHIGAAELLSTEYGVPVLMHEAEVRTPAVTSSTRCPSGRFSRGRGVRGSPWAVHALRSGGTRHVPVAKPQAYPTAGAPRSARAPPSPCTRRGTRVGTAPTTRPRTGSSSRAMPW